jgi:hypothetical protein
MIRWRRTALTSIIEVGLLLLAHAVLLRVMAEQQIVASLFAAGKHVPRLTLMTAGCFVIVRLFAVLLLPGMILARLGLIVMAYRWDSPAQALHPAGTADTERQSPG